MKIEHVLFPSIFSKLRIRLMEGHFYCVHTIRFSEPTKIRSLITDRVNGPLARKCQQFLSSQVRSKFSGKKS